MPIGTPDFWASTEWHGWYGQTYPLPAYRGHNRIRLADNLTTFSIPDGVAPGELITLEFVQHDFWTGYTVSLASATNIVLANPHFFMTPEINTTVSITLRWDYLIKKWVEIARSNLGVIRLDRSDSSGAPGNATINKPSGVSAIAAGASSVVISNNLVTSSSNIFAVIKQAVADATLTQILRVSSGAGTFTIYGNAIATGNVTVSWFIVN
jgi:hypothetical protein